MRAALLAELSDLFVREAALADKCGAHEESDRFWEIADELNRKSVKKYREEVLEALSWIHSRKPCPSCVAQIGNAVAARSDPEEYAIGKKNT